MGQGEAPRLLPDWREEISRGIQGPQDPRPAAITNMATDVFRSAGNLRKVGPHDEEGLLAKVGKTVVGVGASVSEGFVNTNLALGWGVAYPIRALMGQGPAAVPTYKSLMGKVLPENTAALARAQNERLGDLGQLASEMAGGLLGIGIGPGAAVFQTGSRLGQAASAPVSRAIANAFGKGASAGWNAPARAAAGLMRVSGRALPSVAAAAGGFGLFNLLTSDDGERLDAMMHGFVMAPFFAGLSTVAGRVENAILNRTLTGSDKEAVLGLAGQLASPTSGRQLALAINALPARTAAALFEGTGFLLMEPGSWELIGDAFAGDADAQRQLAATWVGSVAGVLALRHNHGVDGWLRYRRNNPELNELELHVTAQRLRQQFEEAPQEPEIRTETLDPFAVEKSEVDAQAMAYRDLARPLLRSGWSPEVSRQDPVVAMQFGPKDEPIRYQRDISGALEVVVPGKVHESITGVTGKDRVVLTGPAAEKFLGQAALRSHALRAAAETWFDFKGIRERDAGGAWSADGTLHTIGLDGKVYARLEHGKGAWRATGEKIADLPVGPEGDPSPELMDWSRMLKDAATLAPDPISDLVFQNALILAHRGSENSTSAAQLREFFAQVRPEELAPILTRRARVLLAQELGAIASGNQNAARAMARMYDTGADQTRGAGREGVPVAPPGEIPKGPIPERRPRDEPYQEIVRHLAEAGKPPETPSATGSTKPPAPPKSTAGEVAGRKDWHKAEPGERVQAARDYAAAVAAESGVETTPRKMRDLFGISRQSARKYLDEARESEAGRLLADVELRAEEKALARKAAAAVRRGVQRGTRTLPEQVAREGGAAGKDLAQRALRAASGIRLNLGEVQDVQVAAEKAASGEVRDYLDTMVPDELGGLSARGTLLMHDRPVDVEAPAEAVRAVDLRRQVVKVLGQQAERSGAVRFNPKTKKHERFRVPDRIAVQPRQAGEHFQEVMNDPVLRATYADIVARGNEGMDPALVEKMFRPFWDKSVDPFDRQAAFEHVRELPYMPDAFVGGDGRTLQVVEGRAREVIESMAHTQTRRSALLREFGPDIPEAARQDLGIADPGIIETFRGFRSQVNAPTAGIARTMLSRLSGVGPERGLVPEWFLGLEGLRRSNETFWAFSYDVVDPMVSIPAYAGYRRMWRALRKVMSSKDAFFSAYRDAVRAGSIIDRVSQHLDLETKGGFARIRDVLTWPGRATEKYKMTVADLTAQEMVKDLKAGKGTASDRLVLAEYLGFTDAEVAAMMSGEGQGLYLQLRHRITSQSTGNFILGEGSHAHQSRQFNFWFAYQRFFLNRLRIQLQRLDTMVGPDRTPADRLRAARGLAQMAFGAALSGPVAVLATYLLTGRGWSRFKDDLAANPVMFLAKAAGAQLVGGLPATSLMALFGTSDKQNIENVAVPIRWFSESWDFARSEKAYRGQNIAERALTAEARLRILPGSRPVRSALAWFGVTSNEVREALSSYYQWREEEGLPRPMGPEPEDPTWWRLSKDVESAVREAIVNDQKPGDSEAFQEAVKAALGVDTGRKLADSLMARRVSMDVRDDAMRQRMYQRLGAEKMRLLYRYDQVLEDLARDYRKEPGTAPDRDDFRVRFDRVMEQTALGDASLLKNLIDETLASATERILVTREVDRSLIELAHAVADYPEVWSRVLSQPEALALRDRRPGEAARILEALFMRRLRGRAMDKRREQAGR